jgi:hypothetical protein
MIRPTLALLAAALAPASAAPSGGEIARALHESTLDAAECYRVRELSFSKEDIRFYFTEGYLIFSKPVNGRRISAIFSAEVDGGDAEILVMPPHQSERRSLATFTGSPNLDEHFSAGLFVLPEALAADLLARARAQGRPGAEMGALMADRWTPVVRNISSGFTTRLIQDLLSPDRDNTLFYAAISGRKLGNFDVIFDPFAREQVLIGQFTSKSGRLAYDTWTSFEARSVARGIRKRAAEQYTMRDFRIEADISPSLRLSAVTRAHLVTETPGWRSFVMLVSDKVRVTEVKVDGAPAEVLGRDSIRDNAMRTSSSNEAFLVITPEPLEPGTLHQIELRHEGDVVVPAGNNVYFVSSRGNWYPRAGNAFSTYDLTFRYPKNLTLVATGDIIDDRTDGDVRQTRRRVNSPVRVAGFNLGQYERARMSRDGYVVEVYGNRKLEPVLQPKPQTMLLPPDRRPRRNGPDLVPVAPPPAPSPASHLASLADDVADALQAMVAQFGPPPLKTLTVAPIPATFGQGFPGLVYLPTLAYLAPDERPASMRDRTLEIFFSDLIAPHEVAHQWWGNLVTPAGYQDEWLMEALANYSSLVLYEKRKGSKALDQLLQAYEQRLLAKSEDGERMESIGPIFWGLRLQSSRSSDAWRVIVYEKGSWIMHMLRKRMGDESFFKMLNEACRRYAFKGMSTEDFRRLAQEFMPPRSGPESLESFFESWVYGTGIPVLKVSTSIKGKIPSARLTVTVTQSEVDDDFSVDAPVVIQFARSAAVTRWVRTSSEPASFTIPIKQPPVRVSIGPDVLAIRK